jgi:hypothetical protein
MAEHAPICSHALWCSDLHSSASSTPTLPQHMPTPTRMHLQAASDVYSPISGEVVETNQALVDEPAKASDLPDLAPSKHAALAATSCP